MNILKIMGGIALVLLGTWQAEAHTKKCSPITCTATVNPFAVAPNITIGAVTGVIAACSGTASASPKIQKFNVSGSNLAADITATAPAGFEVSLSVASGYGNSVILPQSGGTVGNTTLYVRSSSTAPPGNISGTVTLTSAGAADQKALVSGSIYAFPTVDAVSNQTVSSGSLTKIVNFTGTGVAFTWTNDTPGIGLAASGGGSIIPFKGINNTNSPITATITVTPSTPELAYITNQNGNGDISVIDLATNTVVNTIYAGINPFGVSVTPDGSRVYISNTSSNNVLAIDTKTNTVTATIPVGYDPGGIVVSPDGSRVYVTCLDYPSGTAAIWVIGTITNTVISKLSACTGPLSVAVSPDGSRVYVACATSNSVWVVDPKTNTVISVVPVGAETTFVVASPDGKWVYATNFDSNNVSVINAATNTVAATITVGTNPFGITFSADGSRAYVGNYGSNTISVINTATSTVIATITGLQTPQGLSLSADGSRLYVANQTADNVSVIDLSTNTILTNIQVGVLPAAAGNFIASGTGCVGSSRTFTITVNPPPGPAITTIGGPSALTTIYGTASSSTTFTVSGTNMTAGILVTPPPGFEVSTDDNTFTRAVTIGAAGTIEPTTVFIRLTQTTGAGVYSGSIVLSSNSASNVNVEMPLSTVKPAALTITANNVTKTYGKTLKGGPGSTAFTATALQNSETIGTVTITYGAGATAADGAGTYTGSVIASAATGGRFSPRNYTITYVPGDIIVNPVPLTIIADDKTKNYGDPNPVLTASFIGFVNSDGPAQLTKPPEITTNAVITSPAGHYTITVAGAASPNYTISYLSGVLTVEVITITLAIPNTFTPNGDRINDTWDIDLNSYQACTVKIFDRWGRNVFSSTGYGTPWNGTYNGAPLPTGTYYYVIDLKIGSKPFSGFVTIVR